MKCQKYWDFGLEEPAIFDYPSAIDYILDRTGQKSLSYIGYSLGTTHYFILLSKRPEYNHKIHSGFLLGPAIHLEGQLLALSKTLAKSFFDWLEWMEMYEFAGSAIADLSHKACTEKNFKRAQTCHYIWNFLNGKSLPTDERTALAIISNTPAGNV